MKITGMTIHGPAPRRRGIATHQGLQWARLRPARSIEQRTGRNLQRRGEPFDDGDRGIARAPLDVAHIGPMNAGNVGKLFLTPAAVMPEAAQVYG